MLKKDKEKGKAKPDSTATGQTIDGVPSKRDSVLSRPLRPFKNDNFPASDQATPTNGHQSNGHGQLDGNGSSESDNNWHVPSFWGRDSNAKDKAKNGDLGPSKKPLPPAQVIPQPEEPDNSVSRAGIVESLGKYAEVLHMAMRPLPTTTGDGTYVEEKEPPSLVEDLKTCESCP
jgi:hypothetical protein